MPNDTTKTEQTQEPNTEQMLVELLQELDQKVDDLTQKVDMLMANNENKLPDDTSTK